MQRVETASNYLLKQMDALSLFYLLKASKKLGNTGRAVSELLNQEYVDPLRPKLRAASVPY
jgi:hypothetical protein